MVLLLTKTKALRMRWSQGCGIISTGRQKASWTNVQRIDCRRKCLTPPLARHEPVGVGLMSALGHKRTFAAQNAMSALHPKATSNATYPMSAKGHVWTAPGWQELFSRLQRWSVRPCPHRPLSRDTKEPAWRRASAMTLPHRPLAAATLSRRRGGSTARMVPCQLLVKWLLYVQFNFRTFDWTHVFAGVAAITAHRKAHSSILDPD